ncbi:MAG: hypothetical protein M1813_006409 [Trichoglossum hirsutum]|nr:MAG: hypothetical protein M1813_006409 [Trichoglossum hirsutum]
MASLDLKMEDFASIPSPKTKTTSSLISALKSKFGHKSTPYKTTGTSSSSTDKIFIILRDFLQPDAALSLESTAKSILDLLPEEAPLSTEVWSFGELCFELAEQIPYYHPSQIKFARLLEYLGRSTKGKAGFYIRYQRLGESMRDCLNGPEPENPGAWVNYNAFIANLYEYRVWRTEPTYAIWILRDGLETKYEKGNIRDFHVLAAAQWILWNGQSLFKQVLFLGDILSGDTRSWSPGPLYDGEPLLSLHRWHFWRDRFRAIAGEDEVSDECKNVAGKVTDMMDAFEKNLTF